MAGSSSEEYGHLTHSHSSLVFPDVAAHVRAIIDQASDVPAFRDLLGRLMARPGRVLSPTGPAKWPAFVIETCRALGGDLLAAVDGAAAVEFAVAAIDVVDDVIDDEWDDGSARRDRALNASLAVGWLAQRCAMDLQSKIGAERARRISRCLAQGSLDSCAGQDLDMLLEGTHQASEEAAHQMTCQKSGSLVAMACQVGAAIATDDESIIAMIGTFGFHAGTVAQLLNDIAGVKPGATNRGSDLRRRKKTLPIAYALRCAREEKLSTVLAWSQSASSLSEHDEENLATTFDSLGALHYAWIVADAHRREALDALKALSTTGTCEGIVSLRHLLPSVRARRSKWSQP